MTRVEEENTRLRHCALSAHRRCRATSSSGELRQLRCRIRVANRHMSIARLHRKTLCYSKSETMLQHSIRLLIHYFKFQDVPVPYIQEYSCC